MGFSPDAVRCDGLCPGLVSIRPSGTGPRIYGAFPGRRPLWRTLSGANFLPSLRDGVPERFRDGGAYRDECRGGFEKLPSRLMGLGWMVSGRALWEASLCYDKDDWKLLLPAGLMCCSIHRRRLD